MNYKWLKKTNSDKLIIFFNGWGMDDLIVSHLDCGEYDVVVLYDYTNLSINLDIENYKEKHVIAWSMGVMIATLFECDNVKSSTAICGTPYPINDKYGIPQRIYNLTVKGFNETSSKKFMERMFSETPYIEKYSNRSVESQRIELIKLSEYNCKENYNYTKSIVANDDKIIPTNNQLNYWYDPIIIESGHCPFGTFKSWAEIIEL